MKRAFMQGESFTKGTLTINVVKSVTSNFIHFYIKCYMVVRFTPKYCRKHFKIILQSTPPLDLCYEDTRDDEIPCAFFFFCPLSFSVLFNMFVKWKKVLKLRTSDRKIEERKKIQYVNYKFVLCFFLLPPPFFSRCLSLTKMYTFCRCFYFSNTRH